MYIYIHNELINPYRYKKILNKKAEWRRFWMPTGIDNTYPHNTKFPHLDFTIAYKREKKFNRMLFDATKFVSNYQTPKR